MEGREKSVFVSLFGRTDGREFVGKKTRFEASCSTRDKLLLVARHILTTGLQNAFKVGSVKFANSLSPPFIVKKVRIGSKSSSSDAGQKSRELTTPPEPPNRNKQLDRCINV